MLAERERERLTCVSRGGAHARGAAAAVLGGLGGACFCAVLLLRDTYRDGERG